MQSQRTAITQFAQRVNNRYVFRPRLQTVYDEMHGIINKGHFKIAVPLCEILLKDQKIEDHPDVAFLLNILALLYNELSMLEDATNALKKALDIREKTGNEDDLFVAAVLNELALVHSKRGMFEDVVSYRSRAMEITRRVSGSDNLYIELLSSTKEFASNCTSTFSIFIVLLLSIICYCLRQMFFA